MQGISPPDKEIDRSSIAHGLEGALVRQSRGHLLTIRERIREDNLAAEEMRLRFWTARVFQDLGVLGAPLSAGFSIRSRRRQHPTVAAAWTENFLPLDVAL